MSEKEKDVGKVGIERASWLINMMAAKHDPITDDQVEAFGKNPEIGPLPCNCLSVQRIPNACGTANTVEATLLRDARGAMPVEGIGVAPDGKPLLLTLVGGKVAVLGRSGEVLCLTQESGSDTTEIFGWSCGELIGCTSSGEPAVLMSRMVHSEHRSGESLKQYLRDRQVKVYFGNKCVLDERGIDAITLARDNQALIYTKYLDAEDSFAVMRGSVELCRTKNQYRSLTEFSDGRIFGGCIGCNRRSMQCYHFVNVMNEEEEDFEAYLKEEGPDADPVLLEVDHGRQLYVKRERDSVIWVWPWQLHGFQVDVHGWDFAGHCSLVDGKVAFQVRTRHGMVKLVITDKPQPGRFQLISRPFQRDLGWFYYGVQGRHLYTMEIV